MQWNNKKVLVTGGASFIGSHLTEKLVKKGALVRVAENFSSGEIKYLENIDCEVLEEIYLILNSVENRQKVWKSFFT